MIGDRTENIREWLSISRDDLESANLLHEKNKFSLALYHLQQSNEKLEKALLIWMGILKLNSSREDWTIKSVLGFFPKTPSAYRHKTIKPFLSDLQKMLPSLQELANDLESEGFDNKLIKFQNSIKQSRKAIFKLKKRSFNVIEKHEILENEVKAMRYILDKSDEVIDNVGKDIDHLDYDSLFFKAKKLLKKNGIDTENLEIPNYLEIKKLVMDYTRIAILIILTVSMDSIISPLEAITRYPDSKHKPFDFKNPYVIYFNDIEKIIHNCLDRTEEIIFESQ